MYVIMKTMYKLYNRIYIYIYIYYCDELSVFLNFLKWSFENP